MRIVEIAGVVALAAASEEGRAKGDYPQAPPKGKCQLMASGDFSQALPKERGQGRASNTP